ncbi:MAG: hypothetical protein ACI395_05400 [Candidatus Cryptobacteroides sp.]
MNRKGLFIILMLTVLTASCGRVRTAGVDVLPIVGRMIADTSCAGHSILDAYQNDRNGTVAVFGPSEKTLMLTDFLVGCDIFDNVDGKSCADWLPDFAGETFASYMDVLNGLYREFFISGRERELREFVVRGAVAAASSQSYQNVFSSSPSLPKTPSKIFILSSSFASLAEFDVDTLFSAMGKSLPVITPVNALVDKAMSLRRDGCAAGLWADSDVLASGVYADAFHKASARLGQPVAEYVGFSPDAGEDALSDIVSFLDMYVLSGASSPLSVLLLDPFRMSYRAHDYKDAVAKIRSDEKYAAYSRLLSDGFVVADAMTAIAESCYRLMREKDMFTHRIAYPEKVEYTLVASEDEEVPFKFVELTAGYVR